MKSTKKIPFPQLPDWIKHRWQKFNQKEAQERALEPRRLRVLTFIVTFVSMSLGLSLIPLFPQPLPILISFMVAAVSYGYPQFGMPVGCGVIGLALMYQLSTLNFVAMLNENPIVRAAVIVIWLTLFIVPPIVFHRQKAALAINLGILAAVVLLFDQTYFLAVPLILTAGVLFKKNSALTVLYSVLIFVPLLLMQYLKTILQVTRTDWWLDPTAVPNIYAPLSGIFKDIQQSSMVQFRLYDTNRIVTTITDQTYSTPNATGLTLLDALKQYRDSLPGIMLFLAIVAALVLSVYLIIKTITQGSAEKLLPVITAVSAAVLFFVCLSALQVPLAISAKIDSLGAAGAVLATVFLTLPLSFITYSPKKKATNELILAKTNELMARLQTFEENLNKVKNGIPINVTSLEGRMLIIKDKLNDVFSKVTANFYEASELDRKFDELDKGVTNEIEALFSELDISLKEYQSFVNCEYSTWMGKLKAVGLKVEATVKTSFEKEMPIENRIEYIRQVLEAGRSLAKEAIPIVDQIYGIMRSLYDPNLPEESRSVSFAKEKLDEKTPPWTSLDALLVALNNWRRQYSADILNSVEKIKASLGYIVRLNSRSEKLSPELDIDNFQKISNIVKTAETMEVGIEEKTLNVTEVTVISDVFQSSLELAKDMLIILRGEVLNKEKEIENLLPKKDYLWEKNITLRERMATAVEMVSNPTKYGFKQTLENLPKFLSNIDECATTIIAYSERKELLLNYPAAKTAIENQLGKNNQVQARNLPFDLKHSEEYLRLFYSHMYPDFSFDEESRVLAKKG